MGITFIQLLDGLFSNLMLISALCIIDILENKDKILQFLYRLPPIPIEIAISIEIACFVWKLYIIHKLFTQDSGKKTIDEKND